MGIVTEITTVSTSEIMPYSSVKPLYKSCTIFNQKYKMNIVLIKTCHTPVLNVVQVIYNF